MKRVYANFADKNFKKQQNIALLTAKYIGGFDRVEGFSSKDIDADFFSENSDILNQKRGAGYWLWKPYFIKKMLLEISEGDYLFYSDSGAFFLKKINKLIKELEKQNQDIMGFELPLLEKQWTKKELFINMSCDIERYSESNQILASFILIKKTPFSLNFFDEYLKYSCNKLNITDEYDHKVKQDKCFVDHRHDQSIFSLLYKRYNLKPFKDPSQLGKYPDGYSGIAKRIKTAPEWQTLENGRKFKINKYSEHYSLILYHNKNNNPLQSLFKFLVKEFLSRFNLYNGIIR